MEYLKRPFTTVLRMSLWTVSTHYSGSLVEFRCRTFQQPHWPGGSRYIILEKSEHYSSPSSLNCTFIYSTRNYLTKHPEEWLSCRAASRIISSFLFIFIFTPVELYDFPSVDYLSTPTVGSNHFPSLSVFILSSSFASRVFSFEPPLVMVKDVISSGKRTRRPAKKIPHATGSLLLLRWISFLFFPFFFHLPQKTAETPKLFAHGFRPREFFFLRLHLLFYTFFRPPSSL